MSRRGGFRGGHRGGGRGSFSQFNEGDWTCPSCSNVNFARRTQCNRCHEERQPTVRKIKKGGIEIGKQAAEKSKGLFSADDWICKTCGNVNWARRGDCNMCNSPRVGILEERTGHGGGFNERQNVEYNKREDSDDEFDVYGRRKKKRNGSNPPSKPPPEEESGSSDDEEEGGDLSKYDLSGDDDDDDEGDASKYDLEASGSEDDKKSRSRSRSKSRSRSRSPINKHRTSSSSYNEKKKHSRSRSPSPSQTKHRRH